MDLKNKLSEEEAKEIFDMIFPEMSPDGYLIGITRDAQKQITWNNFKRSGIIRKSAREELDEYINKRIVKLLIKNILFTDDGEILVEEDTSKLKQLIDAALKEADERAERKEEHEE